MGETRYKGASCALTGIPLAHLRMSKIAAVNLPASGAICNPSPRFDGDPLRFIWAKRIYAAHSIVAFTGSSGHLRLSKLPSDFRRLRGLLASMRFNGNRFARNRRNAYIRRSALSGLRFALVMYCFVHSLRQIRALRVLLVSTRFDGDFSGLFKRNAV